MREALNPSGVPALLRQTLTRADGTNPAANAEFSVTVPTGQYWLLMAVTVSLAQGATQTPQPTLIIDDGTTTIFQGFGASSAQSSAVTTQYNWAPGNTLTAGAAATVVTAPLPSGLVLGPGYRIRSSTLGIGANTDYGAPGLFYVKFA
jgi:hypothetical protein